MANTIQNNNYKVRLSAVANTASRVVFEVTPTFSESGGVEYEAITPVHLPGGIQVYKRTNSRTFSIGATFISRNSQEATTNLHNLQRLRGWRMPYFGLSSTLTSDQRFVRNEQVEVNHASNNTRSLSTHDRNVLAQERARKRGVELLGAPPDLLYLYAYSTSTNNSRDIKHGVNINRVPVVLTSLDITYPNDVDYIPTLANNQQSSDQAPWNDTSEPFPMKMDVTISLLETHSAREYERFNLAAYKQGKLTGF